MPPNRKIARPLLRNSNVEPEIRAVQPAESFEDPLPVHGGCILRRRAEHRSGLHDKRTVLALSAEVRLPCHPRKCWMHLNRIAGSTEEVVQVELPKDPCPCMVVAASASREIHLCRVRKLSEPSLQLVANTGERCTTRPAEEREFALRVPARRTGDTFDGIEEPIRAHQDTMSTQYRTPVVRTHRITLARAAGVAWCPPLRDHLDLRRNTKFQQITRSRSTRLWRPH